VLVFVCVFGNILSGYSRSLSENNEDPAVTSLNEWLKKEVAIRVEAKEMSHGLQDKPPSEQRFPRRKFDDRKPRAFYTGNNDEDRNKSNIVGSDERLKKPPCIFCGQENHGIWGCNKFKQIEVGDRWKFAKDNRLCFRCLSVDHRGKDCNRSRQCNVNGCQLIMGVITACCMTQITAGNLALFYPMTRQSPHGRGRIARQRPILP
jgi:hypothetical protein